MTAPRKAITPKMKIDILLGMAVERDMPILCVECVYPLLPGHRIEWDHRHAHALDGPHEVDNIRPVHYDCHKGKTKRDVKAIRKADRIARGGRKRKGPPMKSRPFSKEKRPFRT